MELKRIEPFKTIRSLYYANRPMSRYGRNNLKIIEYIPLSPLDEPTFGEKLRKTFKLLFRKNK